MSSVSFCCSCSVTFNPIMTNSAILILIGCLDEEDENDNDKVSNMIRIRTNKERILSVDGKNKLK